MANYSRVHRVKFAIGAWAVEITGVEDSVPRGEGCFCSLSNLLHGSSHIPAKYSSLAVVRLSKPHPIVCGVDRDGLDPHEQIVLARCRIWKFEIDQSLGVFTRQCLVNGDSLHVGLVEIDLEGMSQTLGSQHLAGKLLHRTGPVKE
jgi:hypothetical protein